MKNNDENELLRSTGESEGKRNVSAPFYLKVRCVRILILILLSLTLVQVYAQETVYHTGLEAKYSRFAISPDGRRLVFSTDRISHGLRLLDLTNGNISIITEDVGRTLGFPSWSSDGKQIALISAEVRNGYYQLNDMEVVIIDDATGKRKKIDGKNGVIFFPFFSSDGKGLYYFKGKKRESGKTPASQYDLCVVDLSTKREIRVTQEEFYQASKGDDALQTVVFSAIPNFSKRIKDAFGVESRNALFLYNKSSGQISIIPVDQSSGIFNFSDVRRDKAGNLYFVASKSSPGSSHYQRLLIRTNPEGKQAETLAGLAISMTFDIARHTGEIYVTDKVGEELVFRRLASLAVH